VPDRVRILLLGTPAVYSGDTPLTISRREVRSLLYYLACQHIPVSRANLTFLFWPDEPEEAARKRLREMLARLRKSLPDGNLLITEGELVYLEPGFFSSDVLEFTNLVEETHRPISQVASSTPLPEPVYRKLVRAIHLWRAPHFISGARLPDSETLDQWFSQTGHQLELSYQRILERLTDHSTAVGSLDEAIAWLQAALKIDPLNDALNYRLVRLLDRQERQSEALTYCQQLRSAYINEGFPDLPVNLQTYYRELREKLAQQGPSLRPSWAEKRTIRIPLFGRKAELNQLCSAYQRGLPAIVIGEAGSGKSRLVYEMIKTVEPAPHLLSATAHPLEGELPLQPFIDMLRHNVTADEWRGLSIDWLAPLGHLLPELLVGSPGLRQSSPALPLSQSTLFEAIHQALLHLARTRRVLIFLDDAQWCDEASLNLLAYLNDRNFFGESGSLTLVYRREEENLALQRLSNHLLDAIFIQLLPLNHQEVTDLVCATIGHVLPEKLVTRIRQETGGNPFFLLETLHTLMDYSIDLREKSAIEKVPLASSIHALVRERIRKLSPHANHILNSAAIIGNSFTLPLLDASCSMDSEDFVIALEELEKVSIISVDPDHLPVIAYKFIHNIIREVILLELSPARKRMLHLRVARALEVQAAGSFVWASILATHFEKADEAQPAFRYWMKAAQYASVDFSVADANLAYQHGEQLLQQSGFGTQIPDDLVLQFFTEWGELSYNSANTNSTRHAYEGLLHQGFHRKNPLLVGSSYSGLSLVADLQHQSEAGKKALEQALPFLKQAGDEFEQVQADIRLAGFLMIEEQYDAVKATLEQCLNRIGSEPTRRMIQLRAIARQRLAVNYDLTGYPRQSLEMAELSLNDCHLVMNHADAIRAMLCQVDSNYLLGNPQLALKQALIGQQMISSTKNMRLEAYMLNARARVEYSMGQMDASWQHAGQALFIAQEYGFPWAAGDACEQRGEILIFLNALHQARESFRTGAEWPIPGFYSLNNQIRMGLTDIFEGRTEEGLGTMEQALQISQSAHLGWVSIPGEIMHAWSLSVAGRPAEGLQEAQAMIDLTNQRENCIYNLSAHQARVKALLATQQYEQAYQETNWVACQAQQHALLMIELRSVMNAIYAARGMGLDPCAEKQRIQQLLETLGQNTQNLELRPAFEAKMSQLLSL
jgi:predicted ATPase/DNA-binding SARP family transcriptional activator